MGVWPMNCKRDKQLCAFESATGSSAQTLALFARKSPRETACNSSEKRTICNASPESSSNLEASSKEPGPVTSSGISSTRESRRETRREPVGEHID